MAPAPKESFFFARAKPNVAEAPVDPLSKKKAVRMLIDGQAYSIPDAFARIHPGGDVIYNYNNKDASDVFAMFHPASTLERLKRFPHEPASTMVVPQESKEFRDLRQWAFDNGLFNASLPYFAFKLSILIGLVAGGSMLAMSSQGSIAMCVLGGLLVGLGLSQAGWYAHDVLHHQIFHSRVANDFLGYFIGNFIQGFSVTWWKNKHNTHHACSNVHGEDPDIDTVPFVAWDKRDVPSFNNLSPASKFWLRHQHFFVIPLMGAAQVSWRIQSLFTIPEVRSNRTVEAATLGLHYAAYFAVIGRVAATDGGALAAAAFVLATEVFGGWGKAFPFVLNHSGCEVVGKDHTWSHVRLQVATSRDVVGSSAFTQSLVDFFMGGLNYQIEHHLFPDMPRHNLHLMVPRVKEICKRHSIPYIEECAAAGYKAVYKNLREIASLVPN